MQAMKVRCAKRKLKKLTALCVLQYCEDFKNNFKEALPGMSLRSLLASPCRALRSLASIDRGGFGPLRTRSPSSVALGALLLTCSGAGCACLQADAIRHFALHTLEHIVTKGCANLSASLLFLVA